MQTALILFLLSLGLIRPLHSFVLITNLINLSLLGWLTLNIIQERTIYLLLLFLLITYIGTAAIFLNKLGPSYLQEPVNEHYAIDQAVFLKTFYLMKKGESYYEAFASAMTYDSRFESAPKDSIAWRTPTIFYFWKLIAQNGQHLKIIFLTFSTLSIACVYFLLRKFVPPQTALLSSYLIIPYFLGGLLHYSLMFVEWWGLFFFIFSVTFLYYGKRNFFIGFLIASVMTRELFIIPATIMLFLDFLRNRKIYYPITFFIIVTAFWIFHLVNVSNIIGSTIFSPQSRIHNFNSNFLVSALTFSTGLYAFGYFKIGIIFPIITILGLVRFLYYNKKDRISAYFIFAAVFTLLLLSPFIGTTGTEKGISFYADFWGITFVPLAIIFSPIILMRNSNKI